MLVTTALTSDDLEEALSFIRDAGYAELCRVRASMPGPAYAVRRNGLLLGCGGMQAVEPGLGEPWILLTPIGRLYTHSTYRAIRRIFVVLMRELDVQRVQVLVRHDFHRAQALVTHLGFRLSCEYFKDVYDMYTGERRVNDG